MILIVAPNDNEMIRVNAQQSRNFPEIFGDCCVYDGNQYIRIELDAGGALNETPNWRPAVDPDESVFVSGHATPRGDLGNAEIGDAIGGLSLNGIELWERVVRPVIPDMFDAGIFVDACSSAGFARGAFSLIETFKSQADLVLSRPEIFGRMGEVGYEIPAPETPRAWTELMRG
jgi:hypothetical protein